MAKKAKGSVKERQIVHNKCKVVGCGTKCHNILYVSSEGKKKMMWRCENNHIESTRIYTVERILVR